MRKYIFGIIETGQPATFGQSLLSSRPEPVYTVAHGNLSGVVSNYDRDDLISLSLEDKLHCLVSHQSVIERLMAAGHTILPVKLGTVLWDDDATRRALAQGYRQLARTLAEMRGLVQMEVTATWDLQRVLQDIGHQAETKRLKQSVAGKSARETGEIRLKAGRLVKEALEKQRENYCHQVMSSLAGIAEKMQANALPSDEMVMNIAWLLPQKKQADLERRLAALNEAFSNRLNFRIIGPLPPYSFSTVEITRPDPAQISEAGQLLGLDSRVSLRQLKERYRRLAAMNHPDTHPNDATSNERFTRIREAFVLLRNYCQGLSGETSEKTNGRHFSLTPEDVRQTLLVEIKRPALGTI